jgi:hypothetical protein
MCYLLTLLSRWKFFFSGKTFFKTITCFHVFNSDSDNDSENILSFNFILSFNLHRKSLIFHPGVVAGGGKVGVVEAVNLHH